MIDMSDDLVPLSNLAALLPPRFARLHRATAIRWAMHGVGTPRVKIETVKVGGRRYVTRAAVDRFVARLSADDAETVDLPAVRAKQIQRAEQELDTAGI